MMAAEPAAAFAAFREAVFDDFHLMTHLRRPLGRDAFVAHVLAVAAARGFALDEAAVRAAMRDGEAVSQTPGAETL